MSVRSLTLRDMVQLLIRRRWLVLMPFAAGVALMPVLARMTPERYRSDALIVVIPQQVPDSFVKPTVGQSVEERLPTITDQILSRTRLEHIIRDLDLYKAERARNVMEDVVQMMRQDVTTSATAGKNVDSFRVSYVSNDPEQARKVTERLAALYIDENSKDREAQADHTKEFLDTQLADAKQRLIDQEKKLEAYRTRHAGQMPSELQTNLQAIQTANTQLQSLGDSNNHVLERRLLLERQLADATAAAAAAPNDVPANADGAAPTSTAQQLAAVRGRRLALLQRFTPDYPEIQSLDRMIATLESRLEAETPVTPGETPVDPVVAARQKKVRDLQSEIAVLDYQLENNKKEADRLKKKIGDYQAKVDAVPARESELVELTRDYSTLQQAYASLRMKSEDSMIAANLERRRIGEQFRLVDEASRPQRPYNESRRRMIMLSGAAGGLVLGLLIIALLEIFDSSFRHADELVAAVSVPVLASIPRMRSDREKRSARRRVILLDVAGTVVLLVAGVSLMLWRLRP